MTVSTEYITIASFDIKIGGAKIDAELQDHIVELLVESNRMLPDMFEVHFWTETSKTLDDSKFDIGKSVEIAVGSVVLVKAEITAIEPEFTREGYVRFVIRGYDKSHRLYRGRKTRVFASMSDSDIVQKIVGEAGLQVKVDSSSPTHEHVWQNNQSDMEFICERAQRLGYQVYVENEQVHFVKVAPSGSPIELVWGKNLRVFRPCIDGTHQTDKVTFRSWDPVQKQKSEGKVEGQATSATSTTHQGGTKKDGGAETKKVFGGSAETLVVNYPHLTDGEAKTMAQALYDEVHSGFVQAEGVCIGNPALKAGAIIKVSDVGTRFNGTYVLTAAVHTFTPELGYETTFLVRGQEPDLMARLFAGGDAAGAERALITGVVTAIVTNNTDTEGLGRVKLKFPWLDDTLETHWVRVAAPGGGLKRGFYSIPEVDDEVLVAFEYGDINQPYVIGGLWNKTDEPPKKTDAVVADGKVNERILKSRAGHIIVLNDKQGEEQIIIRDKTEKNEVIIDSANNTMTINVEKDYALTTNQGAVNSTSGKATKITSNDTTDIDSQGNITVKSKAMSTITIEAGGQVTIKGKGIVIESTVGNLELKAGAGKVDIKGLQVSVTADTMAELVGNAMVKIQGGLVKIN